jgi:hypothetical protein
MRPIFWLMLITTLLIGGCAAGPQGAAPTTAPVSALSSALPTDAASAGVTATVARSSAAPSPTRTPLPAASVETPATSVSAESGQPSPQSAGGGPVLPPGTGTPSVGSATTTSNGPTSPAGGNALLSGGLAYLDDRSTPQSLMNSYANALNRKEYLRASSYWSAPAGAPNGPPPYAQFEQGFANTESVQVQFGTIGGDAGAGQLYYAVPTLFNVKTSDGGTQTFAGCYTLHLAQPGFQAAPPFQPLGIQSAVVRQVSDAATGANLLASVCQNSGIRGASPVLQPAPSNPADISANRYLDDHSGPIEVLRSLFNAVNRHEYARAYSYWETGAGAGTLPPFPQFEQGYADTAAVDLVTGEPQTGVGAGQIYYQVPTTLRARQTGGGTQTFVGCYTLHLGQPAIQGVPPFQPLSIASAQVRVAPQGADTAGLMRQACRQ